MQDRNAQSSLPVGQPHADTALLERKPRGYNEPTGRAAGPLREGGPEALLDVWKIGTTVGSSGKPCPPTPVLPTEPNADSAGRASPPDTLQPRQVDTQG